MAQISFVAFEFKDDNLLLLTATVCDEKNKALQHFSETNTKFVAKQVLVQKNENITTNYLRAF